MKTQKITFKGGFHGCKPINFRVPIDITINPYMDIDDFLTDHQIKRGQKHFCDISSCQCNGIYRAGWEVVV